MPCACFRRVGRGCDSPAAQVVGAVSLCVQRWEARHPPPARGLDAPVELEGADAAVGWWESSVQCGETARGVVCAWMGEQGVCRSIRLPPQPSLLLSRQGTATLRSCFVVAIVHVYSSTSNYLQERAPNPHLLAGSGGSYRYTLDREELRDQAKADGGVQVAQCIGHEQRELTQRE